jgi:hypothetical protein
LYNYYFNLFLMGYRYLLQLLAPVIMSGLMSCGGSAPQQGGVQAGNGKGRPGDSDSDAARAATIIPAFDADSAYYYVARQLHFGPRVPNSEAHTQCGLWLSETLAGYADTLYTQETRVRAYNGTILNIKNIIGVFQPAKRNRLLLCAHWDSRPYADWDSDPANHYRPIDGANDGASGVGVLLELARQLHQQAPSWGVDIVFFDAEDYGKHHAASGADEDSWALGSQYWSRNPHIPNYQANFGILLDMVGAANATFKHEGFSMLYAPNIVRKVWKHAQDLGYSAYFVHEDGPFITDDHYYVNTIGNIPTINIIHLDQTTIHGFFPQWHTINDNIEVIDPHTLRAVGQTLLSVIYQQR